MTEPPPPKALKNGLSSLTEPLNIGADASRCFDPQDRRWLCKYVAHDRNQVIRFERLCHKGEGSSFDPMVDQFCIRIP
jgi:hypothetical protein